MIRFKALSLLVLTIAATALANPSEWLECTTPGDALDAVSLGVNGVSGTVKQVLMTVSDESGNPARGYSVEIPNAKFERMLKQQQFHIVFTTPKSVEFGGATTDAVLLNISRGAKPGTYTGLLADRGTVFELTCNSSGE